MCSNTVGNVTVAAHRISFPFWDRRPRIEFCTYAVALPRNCWSPDDESLEQRIDTPLFSKFVNEGNLIA